MKLPIAMYDVILGINEHDGAQTDNWSNNRVLATDAQAAIKKVRRGKDEYIAEVRLVARVD